MDESVREQLQKRFNFETWKAAPRGSAEISTAGLFDVGSELATWTVRRADRVNVPGARLAHRSMWQQARSADVLLRLDLVEAASAAAARELLLELLGQFQSPQIQRLADPPAGELAFGAPGDTVILFSRGNVVAMVRNAGRQVVPVMDFARLVDARLGQGTAASRG
jgi:hypothetical protein